MLAVGFVWWQFEDLATRLALTVVIGKLLSDSDHFVLVAEIIVIVHFCVYWGIQTRELLDLGSPTLTTIGREQTVEQPAPSPSAAARNG